MTITINAYHLIWFFLGITLGLDLELTRELYQFRSIPLYQHLRYIRWYVLLPVVLFNIVAVAYVLYSWIY